MNQTEEEKKIKTKKYLRRDSLIYSKFPVLI